jgi:hypothetical protein
VFERLHARPSGSAFVRRFSAPGPPVCTPLLTLPSRLLDITGYAVKILSTRVKRSDHELRNDFATVGDPCGYSTLKGRATLQPPPRPGLLATQPPWLRGLLASGGCSQRPGRWIHCHFASKMTRTITVCRRIESRPAARTMLKGRPSLPSLLSSA